jgi:hypothetical protein
VLGSWVLPGKGKIFSQIARHGALFMQGKWNPTMILEKVVIRILFWVWVRVRSFLA